MSKPKAICQTTSSGCWKVGFPDRVELPYHNKGVRGGWDIPCPKGKQVKAYYVCCIAIFGVIH